MRRHLKKIAGHINRNIEEIILFFIIILNIFDFLEILSPDWDYIKKILSWSAIGYLIYKASITKIMFGKKQKRYDLVLVLSFFIMSFKNMILYSLSELSSIAKEGVGYWARLIEVSNIPHNAVVVPIQSLVNNTPISNMTNIMLSSEANNLLGYFTIKSFFPLQMNSVFINVTNNISSKVFLIEPKYWVISWLNFFSDPVNIMKLQYISMLLGAAIIAYMSFYFALTVDVKKPSMMAILHEEGKAKSARKIAERFFIVFAGLNFFYIVIFNPFMEWMAIAIDAPLLVVGIFFYLLIWTKHHKKFRPETIIYKIGNVGMDFYEKFIQLFHTKKGIIFAVSGMLTMHLLVDVGNFALPYIVGFHDPLYFEHLGPGHNALFWSNSLFSQQIIGLNIAEIAVAFINYALNAIALVLLLSMPFFIWYSIFTKKPIKAKRWHFVAFFTAIASFVLFPVFKIEPLVKISLAGVDIKTHLIAFGNYYLMFLVLSIVGILGFIGLKKARKSMVVAANSIIIAFFTVYVFYFFLSLVIYYIRSFNNNIASKNYFIAAYLLIFIITTALFYLGAYFLFLYELYKNKHSIFSDLK